MRCRNQQYKISPMHKILKKLIYTLDGHFKQLLVRNLRADEILQSGEESIFEWEASVQSVTSNCKLNCHHKFIMGLERGR